ncbi:MAG: CDP-alcohol phosphatidyltransferase family protein, partial [Thermodesulfobacteriota bacterium]
MNINNAIIIATGTGINGETLGTFAELAVGGIPQLKRQIVIAERAGINSFIIITDEDSHLEINLKGKLNTKSDISWHSGNSPIKLDPVPYLVLQSNLIINPKGLSALMERNTSVNETLFLVDENKTNALGKINKENSEGFFTNGTKLIGAFVFNGEIIEKSVLNSVNLANLAEIYLNKEGSKCLQITDSYWMHLSGDKSSVKKAEDLLFLNIRKSERGWKSRNINRRISIPISRLLIRTPLTPNIISALVGIIGILSGFFYIWGSIVLAGILLELSSILDGCDGEVAKMKLMESRFGQWIDTIYDQISYIFFIVGVPIGYYISTGSSLAIILGGLNVGILLISILWGFYFVAKYADSGSMVNYPSTIDKMFPVENRSIFYKLIVMVRPLIQREYFAFI